MTIFSREWAMPSPDTFSIPPIRKLLKRYLQGKSAIIDPFARNNTLATITNDLNHETTAQYHLDAVDFMLLDHPPIDVALIDPPYSPRQITECYQSVGRKTTQSDTQISPMLNQVKDRLAELLVNEGIVVSCGWNTTGMGTSRGFDIIEIMLCAHGGLHNDTIVLVERARSMMIGGWDQ